jgi:hypothetical protein
MEPNRADLGDSQSKTPGGVFADAENIFWRWNCVTASCSQVDRGS